MTENFSLLARDMILGALHVLVIAINVFGWIHPATRPLQRFVLLLTALSWFALGPWKGWGYCFLTDWHWDVKRALGESPLPASYIHYLLNRKLGIPIAPFWTDVLTAVVFAFTLLVTLGQILWEWRRKSGSI